MTPDEWIYAGLLMISVAFGPVIKSTEGPRKKQIISSTVGILMVMCVCGFHILHSFITALVNCLVVKVIPRHCHYLSFIWCFGYLLFFRTTHYLGLPEVPKHSNAVQLLLTLKMVGLAFEVHDTHTNKNKKPQNEEEAKKSALEMEYISVNPSLVDMMLYSYCYIGLLTGPYFRYRTYHDMIHHKQSRSIPNIEPFMRLVKILPFYAITFFVASNIYTVEYVRSDEFYNNPFWYRLFYMVPMFVVFRMRMYSAWILSEMVCITATLGAYPKVSKPRCGRGPTDLQSLKEIFSPTFVTRHDIHRSDRSVTSSLISPTQSTVASSHKLSSHKIICDLTQLLTAKTGTAQINSENKPVEEIEYDFETIHNIDTYGCEMTSTVREGMRSWNMSVQYWLANFIYRRVPLKAWRTSITMMVSAFWHGIHPGYYMSFLTIPLILVAEGAMDRAFRSHMAPTQQNIYDWICWFFKMRSFDYMCMGFLLLDFESSIRYWACIYFIVHVVTVIFIILGNVWELKVRKVKPSQKVE